MGWRFAGGGRIDTIKPSNACAPAGMPTGQVQTPRDDVRQTSHTEQIADLIAILHLDAAPCQRGIAPAMICSIVGLPPSMRVVSTDSTHPPKCVMHTSSLTTNDQRSCGMALISRRIWTKSKR
jgi:hypothetical protein